MFFWVARATPSTRHGWRSRPSAGCYGVLHPYPRHIAAIRELIRYRKKLIEQCTRELQRLGKVLEDSGIKIQI